MLNPLAAQRKTLTLTLSLVRVFMFSENVRPNGSVKMSALLRMTSLVHVHKSCLVDGCL